MSTANEWLGIDLRHFAALEAVATEHSFSRAAVQLGYTQSAVSQQIAALERAVGERLVERPGGPRPVALTEAGNVLLGHAEAITARLAAARADVSALAEGAAGTLRVGSYQSVGTRILPALMRDFKAAWPNVTVQLTESTDDNELLRLVERGELDVTFMSYPMPEGPFEAVELLRDPFVLLVQAWSPLAVRGETPTLREIGELPLIGYRHNQNTEQRLRVRGIEPNVVFRSDDNGTVHGLVAAGMGAAVIPWLSLDPHHEGVVALDLGNRLTPRLIGLAWHRDRYRLPAAQAFVETAQDVCAGLAAAA
jgi:DNA-binding transcriptional LysR family regulator